MEIQTRELKGGVVRWRVRWRQGDRYRCRTFDRTGDAVTFAADIRRQQLGTLAQLDLGRVTREDYVQDTWAPSYFASLELKTRLHDEQLLFKHVLPQLGAPELRQIAGPGAALSSRPGVRTVLVSGGRTRIVDDRYRCDAHQLTL